MMITKLVVLNQGSLAAFYDAQQNQNPFDITDPVIEDTNIKENIISEDEDGIEI